MKTAVVAVIVLLTTKMYIECMIRGTVVEWLGHYNTMPGTVQIQVWACDFWYMSSPPSCDGYLQVINGGWVSASYSPPCVPWLWQLACLDIPAQWAIVAQVEL